MLNFCGGHDFWMLPIVDIIHDIALRLLEVLGFLQNISKTIRAHDKSGDERVDKIIALVACRLR